MKIVLILAFIFSNTLAFGFSENTFSAGLGYYSDNMLSKITEKETGAASLLGTPDYPLILKYDFRVGSNFMAAAKLSWSVLGRKGVGDTIKSETMHLYFPIGKNISGTNFDWFVGPGIMRQTLKGAGGLTQMSNGTGTATFAVPGRSVTSQLVTLNLGTTYSMGRSNFGLDLVTEGAASSLKRTFNLMFSYTYNLTGGSKRGSK